MSEPLKPCPFCGQERWIMMASGSHWGRLARCAGLHPDDKPCGASGPLRDDDDQAIAAWNRRAPPPAGEIKTLWVYDDQGNTTEMIPDPEGNVLATFDPEGVVYFTVGEPELGPEVEFTVKLSPREAWPPESHMNAEEGE